MLPPVRGARSSVLPPHRWPREHDNLRRREPMERELALSRQLMEPGLLRHLPVCWLREHNLPHLCKPIRPPLGTPPQQPPPSSPEPPLAVDGPQLHYQGRRSRRSCSSGVLSSDCNSLIRGPQHHTGRATDAAADNINNEQYIVIININKKKLIPVVKKCCRSCLAVVVAPHQ